MGLFLDSKAMRSGEKSMRLFALLLQEHPLQCKEFAAYLNNYHEQNLPIAVLLKQLA
jgi:hypothetical protein